MHFFKLGLFVYNIFTIVVHLGASFFCFDLGYALSYSVTKLANKVNLIPTVFTYGLWFKCLTLLRGEIDVLIQ